MDGQITAIHIALRSHHESIAECQDLIGRHAQTLTRLEELVNPQTSQPSATVLPSSVEAGAPARKLDIDHFTEQQKRLLAVFFQNRSVEMSYIDVARVLNKSAYTVKNQMNLIRQKADLFDRSIGNQSRNYFKLKDDLRIEKYLNLGRPLTSPVSTPVQHPSNDGRVNAEPSLAPHADP